MSISDYGTSSTSAKIDSFLASAIQQLEMPIVDLKENCVTVGPYRIITNGPEFEIRKGKSIVATFARRAWAVAYALRLFVGDVNEASTLAKADSTYRKLDEEREQYLYHIGASQRNENWIRGQIFANRLSRVDSEMDALNHSVGPILKYCRM